MNIERLQIVYGLFDDILYSYELYKQLIPFFRRQKGLFDPYEVQFWKYISDNGIQMATIHWNKIFGSEEHNRNNKNTHYTNFVSANEFEFRLMEIGIDFSDTINNMKTFRDTYVAHKDKKIFAVPYFYRPIRIIYEFDSLVKEKHEEIREHHYLTVGGLHEAYMIRIQDYLISKGIMFENEIEESEWSYIQ